MNRAFSFIFLFILILLRSCSPGQKIQKIPSEVSIVPRSGWSASDPRPYKTHILKRITIHHEGTRLDPGEDAAKKIRNIQRWGMGVDRNWVDIPYHFLIAPDGIIYEGRDVNTPGETATEYDPTGHLLITCMGNFEEQEVPERQLQSLIRLIAYCCKKYTLDHETLGTHRNYSVKTSCPGKNLYKYFENGMIKDEVRKLVE